MKVKHSDKQFSVQQIVFVKHKCPYNGHFSENDDLDIWSSPWQMTLTLVLKRVLPQGIYMWRLQREMRGKVLVTNFRTDRAKTVYPPLLRSGCIIMETRQPFFSMGRSWYIDRKEEICCNTRRSRKYSDGHQGIRTLKIGFLTRVSSVISVILT